MTTETLAPPICKTINCKRELTYLEESGCWRCLICNPIPKSNPTPSKEKTKYIDVAMTEGRVREIVRDELENWHIHKPPVTATEVDNVTKILTRIVDPPPITTRTKIEQLTTQVKDEVLGIDVLRKDAKNWREQAKELGIPLFHRKKADVLAEIKERTNGRSSGSQD